MSLEALYPGRCVVCNKYFPRGTMIDLNVDKETYHAGCDPDLADISREVMLVWDVTAETIDRQGLLAREEFQYGPQVRPACPGCFLELPASGVCGQCQ